MDIQEKTELAVTEALQTKMDLKMKEVNSMDKFAAQPVGSLVQQESINGEVKQEKIKEVSDKQTQIETA